MTTIRAVAALFVLGMSVPFTGTASAQSYPTKPVRILTSEPGGSGDFTSRLLAQGLTEGLGQQVIVENRPTALIPSVVAQAPPDGYMLMVAGPPIWLLPLMRSDASYDPVRDFSSVSLTNKLPYILVVHPSLPVKSVKDLIALAKARPGDLNYAHGAAGGPAHLSAELFKVMASVQIVTIPYKGGGPAMMGLLGGQTDLMFTNAPSIMPQVKAAKVRALAVTSAEPSALTPGLPTVAASGLPGYESIGMNMMLAPARTPVTVINRLNREIVQFLSRPDIKEKCFNAGTDIVGSTPEELTATIKSEMAKWGKLIKEAGIRAE